AQCLGARSAHAAGRRRAPGGDSLVSTTARSLADSHHHLGGLDAFTQSRLTITDTSTMPHTIDEACRDLPSESGLYFVYDGATLLYIEAAKNIRERWARHHRRNAFRQRPGTYRIEDMLVGDIAYEALDTLERQAIAHDALVLNGKHMLPQYHS